MKVSSDGHGAEKSRMARGFWKADDALQASKLAEARQKRKAKMDEFDRIEEQMHLRQIAYFAGRRQETSKRGAEAGMAKRIVVKAPVSLKQYNRYASFMSLTRKTSEIVALSVVPKLSRMLECSECSER